MIRVFLVLIALVATGCALHHRQPPPVADVAQWTLEGSVSDDDLFCVGRTIRESPSDLIVACVRVKAIRGFVRGLRAAE